MPETDVEEAADRVASILSKYRFRYSTEKDLQSALVGVFAENGIDAVREVSIAMDDADLAGFLKGKEPSVKRDIFDFYDAGTGLAIEVKVGGTLADATRQVHRYLGHPGVRGLVLVTTRSKLAAIPREMRGKLVRVVVLPGGLA